MIVRVLQVGESLSRGEIVVLPGMGACQVCDEAQLSTVAQLTAWLAAARTAATAAMVQPRLMHVVAGPDKHVYLALDANNKVAAQVTAT